MRFWSHQAIKLTLCCELYAYGHLFLFFFSSRRRHTRSDRDWSSDVCSSDLTIAFYAHYDGQPVDPSQWKSEPWKPVMRDRDLEEEDWRDAKSIDPEWRLFARADRKSVV